LEVEDGVDGHRGLSRLTVADDEFALTPANGDHAVDGFDAGVKGLLHALALDHAGSLDLQAASFGSLQVTLTVQGDSHRIHHAAQKFLASGNLGNASSQMKRVPFMHFAGLAHENGPDYVGFQVEGDAIDLIGEFQQFAGHGILEPVNDRDAVAHLQDLTNL